MFLLTFSLTPWNISLKVAWKKSSKELADVQELNVCLANYLRSLNLLTQDLQHFGQSLRVNCAEGVNFYKDLSKFTFKIDDKNLSKFDKLLKETHHDFIIKCALDQMALWNVTTYDMLYTIYKETTDLTAQGKEDFLFIAKYLYNFRMNIASRVCFPIHIFEKTYYEIYVADADKNLTELDRERDVFEYFKKYVRIDIFDTFLGTEDRDLREKCFTRAINAINIDKFLVQLIVLRDREVDDEVLLGEMLRLIKIYQKISKIIADCVGFN